MMRIVYLLLFVMVLMSCKNESNPQEKNTTENAPCVSDTIIESGTYDLGEFHIKFDVLSINYCLDSDSINYEKPDSIKEKQLLEKDSKLARKESNKLILKLDNKKTKVFESLVDEDEFGFDYGLKYYYGGYLSEINKYLIIECGFEWSDNILIDRQTGDLIRIGEYNPVIAVSPDKKYFVCRNTLGGYNDEHTGLTIYSNTTLPKIIHRESDVWYRNDETEIPSTPIKNLKFKRELESISTFEAYELKWIDNKTIYFKAIGGARVSHKQVPWS